MISLRSFTSASSVAASTVEGNSTSSNSNNSSPSRSSYEIQYDESLVNPRLSSSAIDPNASSPLDQVMAACQEYLADVVEEDGPFPETPRRINWPVWSTSSPPAPQANEDGNDEVPRRINWPSWSKPRGGCDDDDDNTPLHKGPSSLRRRREIRRVSPTPTPSPPSSLCRSDEIRARPSTGRHSGSGSSHNSDHTPATPSRQRRVRFVVGDVTAVFGP